MTMYIYAVCQSAHHDSIGTKTLQVTHEGVAEVFAVVRNLSGANHADDVTGIQVGRTAIINEHRRIGTVLQALGIVLIVDAQTSETTFPTESQLLFGSSQMAVHCGQNIERLLRSRRHHLFQRLAILVDGSSRTQFVNQLMQVGESQ